MVLRRLDLGHRVLQPELASHAFDVAHLVPVGPEGPLHAVDVLHQVGALLAQEGLLGEVQGHVEELHQVAEERAVDGGGLVTQQEGLVPEEDGHGSQVVEGQLVRLLGGVAGEALNQGGI